MTLNPAILVVSNDACLQMLLECAFANELEVTCVENCFTAIAWLHSGNKVELLLIDFDHAEINGNDFIESVRKMEGMNGVQVIALSGKEKTMEQLKGVSSNYHEPLSKPFKKEELTALINSALRSMKAA